MSKPRLLVITGSSGVGKSTLSARAAASLEFSKIATTDTIRETLRTQFDADQLPALHRSSFEPAGSGVVQDWHETVKVLSEGVAAVVRRASMKGSDLLLEGVHVIPGAWILDDWKATGGVACGVVLYVADEDRHQPKRRILLPDCGVQTVSSEPAVIALASIILKVLAL